MYQMMDLQLLGLGYLISARKHLYGKKSLQDYLSVDLGLDLKGWHLRNALGISSDGNTLVGYGTNPEGYYEAFTPILALLRSMTF